MPTAVLFPGQNSRYPEMFTRLLQIPANVRLLHQAGEVLGRDLAAHYTPDNQNMFRHNRDVQVGVFLANHMHWQALVREGLQAEYSAGLSLGEYNHLVHIGALGFEDALRILDRRGEAYERAPQGSMAAVFPVVPEEVEALTASLSVAIGIYNSSRQCVLSGSSEAVAELSRILEEDHFAHSVVIESRLPMHSPLFRGAGEELREALEAATWRHPRLPYLPNVLGSFLDRPTASDFVDLLVRHTWSPVRWRQSMEALCALSPEMHLIETGPGSVLSDFFGRKWLNPKCSSTDRQEVRI